MRVVITGLPQSGQQQLFSVLTGIPLDTINLKPLEPQNGICEVKDPRMTKLSGIYKPKKTVYAKIEYRLLPDFNLQGPAKAAIFTELKNADELCWVSRGETALEDISTFVSELFISDMMLVEKRMEAIEKDQSKKFVESREKEKILMQRCKDLIDKDMLLKDVAANKEEEILLKTYQLLTAKPMAFVINSDDGEKPVAELIKAIQEKYGSPCVFLSAELEEEISRLEESERPEFMKDMGISEPAIDKMNRMVFDGLGLMSFFTVGEDEVRAWPVKKGSLAPQAACAVHSDIEKGFVRAETFKYTDLLELGSESKLKEAGKFHVKGRDYTVEDGDILNFRFNI